MGSSGKGTPSPSISDRLAKLGLGTPTGPSSPSPSPSSPSGAARQTPVRTGAAVSVSEKRSRFAANAEDKPLLPQGGSFGFAPAKPRASTGGSRFADEKPRVASLGAGRAPVPLDVVKPRSVSAGNSPGTSDNGSAPGSRAASRQGTSSREGSGEEPPQPAEATPVPSPTQATPSALDSLSLPSGMRTPGAMSVSSMRVETGSVDSSEGGPNPADIDVQASLAARDMADSPLSSPVLAGIAIPAPSDTSASSMDSAPPTLKNPLDSLRASSPRPGSIRSISSLSVEAASEDVADLSEMSVNGSSAESGLSTPTIELSGLALGDNGSANGDGEAATAEGDEHDDKRLAQMNAELAKYEADERDPAALGPYQEDEPSPSTGGDNGESKEPPFRNAAEMEEEIERPETPKPGARTPTSPIPGVKCSDCGEEVQLIELADHSCAPTTLPPALSSPPTSPPAPEGDSLPTPTSPPASIPDVPEEPLDYDFAADPTSTRSTPRRSKKRSNDSSVEKLDAFVPQTDDLVPEDILDAYGEDAEDEGDDDAEQAAVPASALSGVPQDVADVPSDDLDTASEPGAPAPFPARQAEPMARSASTPGGAPRLRKPSSGKPRVQSAYGGPMPGRYYDSDDEDDGEPGSATIVRSPSWHQRAGES